MGKKIKTCVAIIVFVCSCKFSFAQEEPYQPKYEPLKDFVSKAPDYLLKKLDSIFLFKKQVELVPYTLDHIGDYTSSYEPITGLRTIPENYRLYNYQFSHFFDKNRTNLIFDTNYTYYIPRKANEYFFKKLQKVFLGNQTKFLKNRFKWDAPYTNRIAYRDSNALFFSTSSVGIRHNVPELRAPKGTGYLFSNILIDSSMFYVHPNSAFYNSILNDGVSASIYKSSILTDSHNIDYARSAIYNYDTSSLNDFLIIDSCYVHNYKLWSNLKRVSISNSVIDSLTINSDSINTFLVDQIIPTYYHDFTYDNRINGKSEIKNKNNSKYLEVKQTKLEDLIISSPFHKIVFDNVNTTNNLKVNEMADTLILIGGVHSNIKIYQENREGENKAKIFFDMINLEKLDTRWLGYELFKPDSTISDEQLNSLYRDLLSHFKLKGFDDSYAELDKEHRSWINKKNGDLFLDWFQRTWSNYGYNKERIVWNTIYILSFFSFLNSLWLKNMSKELYKDGNIVRAANNNKNKTIWIRWIFNIPASIFYTARIFFGLGFKYDNLVYKDKLNNYKIVFLLYFFLIFVSGLICLAYILNYVISL